MNEQTTNTNDTPIGEQQSLPLDPPLEENPTITAITAENDELKTVLRLRDAREVITKDLVASGARSPMLLFDTVREKLQFDESGAVQNAAAIVGMLKQAHPEQFQDTAEKDDRGPSSIDAGTGIGQRGRPLTREALAGMTASQIASLDWADVRQVLSE